MIRRSFVRSFMIRRTFVHDSSFVRSRFVGRSFMIRRPFVHDSSYVRSFTIRTYSYALAFGSIVVFAIMWQVDPAILL